MASFVVDGLVVPVSVAGHPALDFCNTRAGWGRAGPKEYLHTHAHLAVWARENGLIEPATVAGVSRAAGADPGAAAQVLTRALALRSALYAVLVDPPPSTDTPAASGAGSHWVVVDREVRAAASASGLTPGRPARWRITDQSCVDGPLLAIAWSAWDLLTSPAAGHVGACPGAGCGWLFTDPRGRRRWCSMAWCGNRAKVRRYARRTRSAVDPDEPD